MTSSVISSLGNAIKTYTIPLLAIAGVVMAGVTVVRASRPPEAAPPLVEPARAPFDAFVAGSGIVEASSENIAVGTPVPGVVSVVRVTEGDQIKAGDVIFEIDAREIDAMIGMREAALEVAKQNLARLEAQPRPESIPPAEAMVAEAKASLADAQDQLRKWESVEDPRAVADDVVNRRRFAVQTAQAKLAAAEANLALIKAGTYAPELAVARAQVASAAADLRSARVERERRIIRAAIDGTVLQVNVRPGEYAAAGAASTPLVMLGRTQPLHVRVDVDEHEAWRVRAGSKAEAFLRGNSSFRTPLTFVRFEPYILPKRSLTGDSTERVDTRVLQVLFKFDRPSFPIYVGQQMDVYIQAEVREQSTPAAAQPKETGS